MATALTVFVGATTAIGVASLGYALVGKTTDMMAEKADSTIEFFGSQLGGSKVVSYAYTSDPWRLLLHDIYYFFYFWRNWIYIVSPVRPSDSGDMGELAPTRQNIFCLAVHGVLVVAQLTFIMTLPFAFVLPTWIMAGWVVLFLVANWFVCQKLLNADELLFENTIGPKKEDNRFPDEQWIFLNGVAAGKHWMISNLNRLAITFKRPILGIHNRTHGILFDTIECLIQRNFTYATSDVRMCYARIKEKLYDPSLKRVVFILHSQGGIEGGLVLDWLIQELPQDMLLKLEVYTFGCAANHFNNPHRHALSQRIAHANPAAITATTTITTQVNTKSTTEDDLLEGEEAAQQSADELMKGGTTTSAAAGDIAAPPRRTGIVTNGLHMGRHDAAVPVLETNTSMMSTTSTVSAAADRAIGHIEHYAHTSDFVARWGVLHFAADLPSSTEMAGGMGVPRYMGRVFARTSPRGGHQFCQHYLDGMFPLVRTEDGTMFASAMEEGNAFMESEVNCHEDAEREGDDLSSATASATSGGVAVHGLHNNRRGTNLSMMTIGTNGERRRKKVKDLSRLWGYVNGKTPADLRL